MLSFSVEDFPSNEWKYCAVLDPGALRPMFHLGIKNNLKPQGQRYFISGGMFGETAIFYIKIWFIIQLKQPLINGSPWGSRQAIIRFSRLPMNQRIWWNVSQGFCCQNSVGVLPLRIHNIRWWCHVFCSPRNLGKMKPFWRAYFSHGLVKNHQPLLFWGSLSPCFTWHQRSQQEIWVIFGCRLLLYMIVAWLRESTRWAKKGPPFCCVGVCRGWNITQLCGDYNEPWK